MRYLKHKLLVIRRGYIVMAKQTLAVLILSGVVLMTAPLTGLAEATPESLTAEVQVEETQGRMSKFVGLLGGVKNQVVSTVTNVIGTDARHEKLKTKYRISQERNLELELKIAEKQYVSGLELMKAEACVVLFRDFLGTLEGGR
jgi:hypothetical protein